MSPHHDAWAAHGRSRHPRPFPALSSHRSHPLLHLTTHQPSFRRLAPIPSLTALPPRRPCHGRTQVSPYIYDRSLWLFATVFAIDCLNALFESKNTKLDYVLLPAFVKGMATTSNMLLTRGWATLALTSTGRV